MGEAKSEKDVEKELDEIKEAVRRKKLRWKPGRTSLSTLSDKDRRQMLGAVIGDDELRSMLKKQEAREKKGRVNPRRSSLVDPPSKWDWRDVSGTNWTTRIRDQGWCGSCGAFSVVAVLEMMVKRWIYQQATVDPTTLVDLSEAHLFFDNHRHCRVYDCTTGFCSHPNWGWWIPAALNYLKNNWICFEDCFPYNGPNRPCNSCTQICTTTPPGPPGTKWTPGQPCSTCNQPCTQPLTLCPEWNHTSNIYGQNIYINRIVTFSKIKDWQDIYDHSVMKKTLSEHGCLVARMLVYNDFFDYPNYAGIYQHAWGPAIGGHFVAVVGYNDKGNPPYWICKNSWGTGWGEAGGGETGGWFRIAYNECGIDEVMYKIDLFCPAEESAEAMGFGKDTIETVRKFRDVLLTTRKGKTYLDLAQSKIGNVTRVFQILKRDEKIREEVVSALKPFIEAVMTMHEPKPLVLEEGHFRAAVAVLDKIAEADRRLKPSVDRIKRETPRYVGKSISQIMRELS